jgi:hypothetical protein
LNKKNPSIVWSNVIIYFWLIQSGKMQMHSYSFGKKKETSK